MNHVKRLALASTLLTMALPCGCMSLKRLHYNKIQSGRVHASWNAYECSQGCIFTKDFKDGWLVGYFDVVTGGTGDPPLIPPRRYWRPNQTIDNCDAGRLEWYRGFQTGVACAVPCPDSHHIRTWNAPCPPAPAHLPASEDLKTAPTPIDAKSQDAGKASPKDPNSSEDSSPEVPKPETPQDNDTPFRTTPPPRIPMETPPKSPSENPPPLRMTLWDEEPDSNAGATAAIAVLADSPETNDDAFHVPVPVNREAGGSKTGPSTLPAATPSTKVRPDSLTRTDADNPTRDVIVFQPHATQSASEQRKEGASKNETIPPAVAGGLKPQVSERTFEKPAPRPVIHAAPLVAHELPAAESTSARIELEELSADNSISNALPASDQAAIFELTELTVPSTTLEVVNGVETEAAMIDLTDLESIEQAPSESHDLEGFRIELLDDSTSSDDSAPLPLPLPAPDASEPALLDLDLDLESVESESALIDLSSLEDPAESVVLPFDSELAQTHDDSQPEILLLDEADESIVIEFSDAISTEEPMQNQWEAYRPAERADGFQLPQQIDSPPAATPRPAVSEQQNSQLFVQPVPVHRR